MKFARVAAATLCCTVTLSVGCRDSAKAPSDAAAKSASGAPTPTPKSDADPQASAEAAIKSASDAYAAVKADAEKYLPEQAKAMENMLASLQSRVERRDYAAALSTAQLVTGMISALGSNISANKTDLAAWAPMATSIPPMLAAVTSRLDELTTSQTTPEGVTKGAIDRAKADLKAAKSGWDDALAAAAGGTYLIATEKANEVKSRLTSVMTALKMQKT